MPSRFKIAGFALWLLIALYGLRKSPLLWLQELSSTLKEFGLEQILGELYLWTDYQGILLFFFIDNIAAVYTVVRERDLKTFLDKIKSRYKIKDLGTVK